MMVVVAMFLSTLLFIVTKRSNAFSILRRHTGTAVTTAAGIHTSRAFVATRQRRHLSNSKSASSSTGGGGSSLSADDFIQMQKEYSLKNMTAASRTSRNDDRDSQEQEEAVFLRHQQNVFDDMSDFFGSADATPPDVVPILQYFASNIVQKCIKDTSNNNNGNRTIRIMDIGCGTGALFPFYVHSFQQEQQQQQYANRSSSSSLSVTQQQQQRRRRLDITGVDLSPNMVRLAQDRANNLTMTTQQRKDDFSISVINDDFVTLMQRQTTLHSTYDAVVANACFGNFFDTDAVLDAMVSCLKVGGTLYVTHPLGANFVQRLHDEDPETVPHTLPTRTSIVTSILSPTPPLPLQVTNFVESFDDYDNHHVEDNTSHSRSSSTTTIYFLSATKTPYRPLPYVMRFRGSVDTGFGRGGKKLGFPTANLPSSLFANALEHVDTGVYFGYAVIENTENDANGNNDKNKTATIYKAAVNVGYSPTFEGQENAEKIIEAHLITDDQTSTLLKDFYYQPMRLVLCGYCRPEQKFDSFPDLMAAITHDVDTARHALDSEPYVSIRNNDPFLNVSSKSSSCWVGTSGGDETASWEFEEFLQSTAQ